MSAITTTFQALGQPEPPAAIEETPAMPATAKPGATAKSTKSNEETP